MKDRMYGFTVVSGLYGTEEFTYDSYAEAQAGLARVAMKAVDMNDGVERHYNGPYEIIEEGE